MHLPPIGAVLAIVFLFVLAESLTRPRLADIYEIAGRLLVSTALAFCLAGIFYLFVMVIGGFDTMYLNAVLAAIVFLVLFEPLQTEVETRIHQFFFRERYDLETSVAELRKRLAHVLEIDEMVATLMPGLERSRRVTTRGASTCATRTATASTCVGSIGAAVPKRVESARARPLLDRLETQASLSLEEVAREGNRPTRRCSRRPRRSGTLQSAVVLAVRGERGGTRRPPLRGRRPRARRVHAGGDRAPRDGRGADRRRRREQPRLLAHEGARPARGARLDGRRPRARGQEPARRDQGRGAAPRRGGRRRRPDDPTAREFVGIILEEVNRLDRVVGSFLDYARPARGQSRSRST